jgi:hypothetical protein
MRKIYEQDHDAFPADGYAVKGYDGVAFRVLGWQTEPDEDTEWSGYEVRTGNVIVRMIGDDHDYVVEPDDLVALDPDAYCDGCGQVGCGWH